VVGRLGKGAMGIVYSAYDDVMERPVAIKVMMADVQDDPETSARFYREAHAAGQLVHRNIITIFDLGDDDGRPYIVMELLEGRTLNEFLRRPEGVRLEDKISLMLQLCEGLQLAHGKGIFHRDIKPGNLLISDDGRLKIVDFGIARLSNSSMTMSGLIVGTPDYMSPEQARGAEIDERSDIFSAGAVFYYMLTGRKPFAAADLPAVLEKVQSEDPLPIREAEAPPALVGVVLRALAKSPADRYQKAAVMWADLVRVERELAHDSRRVSDEVRNELEALAAVAAERDGRCAAMGVPPGPTSVAAFREDLVTRYPAAADWLDRRSNEFLDWASARERRREVVEMRRSLESELATLVQATVNFDYGVQMADANPALALQYIDAVLQALPVHAGALAQRSRLLGLIAERQAVDDRTRALIAEAQSALSRADWSMALDFACQALAFEPSSAAALQLRDRANEALLVESRNRKLQGERAMERADKLARKGRFDEAEEALTEAAHYDPESAALANLTGQIRSARLDAERASALDREAAEILASTRTLFDSGQRVAAIEELRAFLSRAPHAQAVAAALNRLVGEAERLAAEERRRAEATELAVNAEAALTAGDHELALTLAQQALAADRREPLARKIEGLASAKQREVATAREREERCAQMLQDAQALIGRGRFGPARDLLRKMTDLRPGDERAAALLVVIAKAEVEAREHSTREEEAKQRARAAAPILAQARTAESQHDFVRAGWLAENALALDVDSNEARQLLERVRAKLSTQPALADETVKVGNAASPSVDPDATVRLSAPPSAWHRFLEAIQRHVLSPLKGRSGHNDARGPTPRPPAG
jgi:tetratricopeptide (TPR) repeat protein